MTANRVIVLNADMSILGTTNWKRAIRLIVKGTAEVISESERVVHPSMKVPNIIRLIKAIRHLWRKEVPWTKPRVHVRDLYQCQYCGRHLSKHNATVDHVIPKSHGGKDRWENTVCSCFSCNNTKDNRTPSQANMTLLRQPHKPTIMEFMLRKIKAEGLEQVLKDLDVY